MQEIKKRILELEAQLEKLKDLEDYTSQQKKYWIKDLIKINKQMLKAISQ